MIAVIEIAEGLRGAAPLHLWLALVFGTYVSEDLTCISAGLLVAQGEIGYLSATSACAVGIFSGDFLVYLAGYAIGDRILRRRPFSWWVDETALARGTAWFDRRGPAVIFASRFLPGTRLATYLTAGILRVGWRRFCLYFLAAVIIWTPVLVGLSALAGDFVAMQFDLYERYALPGAIGLALTILVLTRLIVPLFSHRGRRLLLGRYRRLTQWEFWSPWIFYPPVLCYVVWLALRHRSATLFTACNPAIPDSGFIGEDKTEILRGLAGADDAVARWALIPAGVSGEDAAARVDVFLEEHALTLPVVLKPNAGQRGMGVAVAHDRARIASYFAAPRPATLVQEYVAGDEFGVFYYRMPDAAEGELFSITDKRLPELVGDGRSTLEDLILSDARAICMAQAYFRALGPRLDEVPAKDARVQLVEIGTHCRGAVFLDGRDLITEALRRRIDAIAKGYPGFHFGRFDLRAPDRDTFRDGDGFKILELNGVTAEATHIYAPGTALWSAYRTLCQQWRIAFEIGAQNRQRGTRPSGVVRLLREAIKYEGREA